MTKPNHAAWDLAEEFSPGAAAYLWLDEEPPKNCDFPEAPAIRELMHRIETETGITSINVQPHKLRATRAELLALAEKLKVRPPFLFAEERDFQQSEPAEIRQREKKLGTREKRTLLVIIEALAQMANVDTSHPEAAATTIGAKTETLGAPVDRRTISNKLREIPSALEARSKDER